MSAKSTYWLTDKASTAVSHLQTYNENWNSVSNTAPLKTAYIRNFLAYNSNILKAGSWDSSLIPTGQQGEMLEVLIPKARGLIRQLVSLITKTKLNFKAMALSDGEEVMSDVRLANSIMDSITDAQSLDLLAEQVVENSLVLGSGFLKTSWSTARGEPYDYTGGKVVYTGGVEISVLDVFSTIFDPSAAKSFEELPWVSCLVLKNRYDLIAQHPNLKTELLAVPSYENINGANWWYSTTPMNSEDTIPVYETYSKRSPALPRGRLLIWCNENCVLFDGPSPYDSIPIYPLTPEPILGQNLCGYPLLSSLLPCQEMLDNVQSSIASNNAAFGTQNIMTPRGSGLNVQDLTGGMRLLQYTPMTGLAGGGRPEPLQLTSSSPEAFRFSQDLDSYMRELSQVSKIMSGDSQGATSGSMVATLMAQGMEQVESLKKAYNKCFQQTMYAAINCYKNFAKIPQKITVKGGKRDDQVTLREFSGEDLKKIAGVKIEAINPLMSSISGRLEVAAQLSQIPDEQSRYEYISVLEGKPLSSVLESYVSQEALVSGENESLLEAKTVSALATDSHAYHVREHSKLLNSPEIRRSSDHLSSILAHIQEHVTLQKETSPDLLAMVSGQPQPMPMGQVEQQAEMGEMLSPPSDQEGNEKAGAISGPAAPQGPPASGGGQ
tara:strand:+ start:22316 stop:24307 length:1992 start_codon:yes stop_codon:yes gene_type:complete